jgi:hypothetical protein
MPRYSVVLPVTGYVYTEVEAYNETDAIDKALEHGFSNKDIEEWEVHERVTDGNISYAVLDEAEVTFISQTGSHQAARHRVKKFQGTTKS